MLSRVIGVFMLNGDVFKDIEHDQGATGQAAIVVAIVALLSGIGNGIGATFSEGSFFGGFASGLIATFIGWVLFSGVVYVVGTSVFGGKADMGEMLRVVGFAFAPQILAIIPVIGACIGLIWSLLALFVAVREGLDLTTGKTIATILIGFVLYFAVAMCLGFLLGGFGTLAGGMGG